MKEKYYDKYRRIGLKISYYRRLRGMTQEELSVASGIDYSQIRRYETGARNPKFDQLQSIAGALGVGVTEFVDFKLDTVGDVVSLLIELDDFLRVDEIEPQKCRDDLCIEIFAAAGNVVRRHARLQGVRLRARGKGRQGGGGHAFRPRGAPSRVRGVRPREGGPLRRAVDDVRQRQVGRRAPQGFGCRRCVSPK